MLTVLIGGASMTPSQMLLETFDSIMVILVKLEQRIYKLEGHHALMGPRAGFSSIKEDLAHTKTLIGRYYGACKAAEEAPPFVPGIPAAPWRGEDGRRETYRRRPEEEL